MTAAWLGTNAVVAARRPQPLRILVLGGTRFIGFHGAGSSAGSATPSALTGNGSAFTVTYATVTAQQNRARVATAVSAGRLFH